MTIGCMVFSQGIYHPSLDTFTVSTIIHSVAYNVMEILRISYDHQKDHQEHKNRKTKKSLMKFCLIMFYYDNGVVTIK